MIGKAIYSLEKTLNSETRKQGHFFSTLALIQLAIKHKTCNQYLLLGATQFTKTEPQNQYSRGRNQRKDKGYLVQLQADEDDDDDDDDALGDRDRNWGKAFDQEAEKLNIGNPKGQARQPLDVSLVY